MIEGELAAYGAGLGAKPRILALSKADTVTPQALGARRRALEDASGRPVFTLSAASGAGMAAVLDELQDAVMPPVVVREEAWSPI